MSWFLVIENVKIMCFMERTFHDLHLELSKGIITLNKEKTLSKNCFIKYLS